MERQLSLANLHHTAMERQLSLANLHHTVMERQRTPPNCVTRSMYLNHINNQTTPLDNPQNRQICDPHSACAQM